MGLRPHTTLYYKGSVLAGRTSLKCKENSRLECGNAIKADRGGRRGGTDTAVRVYAHRVRPYFCG